MIVHTELSKSKIINKLYLVEAFEDDTKEELKKTDIKFIKFGFSVVIKRWHKG